MHAAGADVPRLLRANGAITILGVHLARRLLMVVVIIPALGWAAARRGERTGQSRRQTMRQLMYARYAIAGLVIGGAWIWRAGASLWEHALRLLIVLVVVAPTLGYLRRRRATRGGGRPSYLPLPQLIGAKLVLIVIAVGVQWLLERSLSATDASVIVGVGLGLTVAVGGPQLHRYLIRRRLERH